MQHSLEEMTHIKGIDVLRLAMEMKGWGELELANASGVHVTVIRRWFGKYGKPTKISPENAERVAVPLGVSANQIVFGKTKRSAA